jgi:hypothetical protein
MRHNEGPSQPSVSVDLKTYVNLHKRRARWRNKHSQPRLEQFHLLRDAIAHTAEPKLNEDARAIENRVHALSADELLARYHELVDKRLEKQLLYTEYFELDRINARIEAEDQSEVKRLTALEESWRQERSQLVGSIERLLARFEATD